MDATVFAELVLDAMRIREEGYDHEAADRASDEAEKKRLAEPDNWYVGHVDYSKFYQISQLAASQAACRKKGLELFTQPVYLLCECAWNDVQSWASEVLAEGGGT